MSPSSSSFPCIPFQDVFVFHSYIQYPPHNYPTLHHTPRLPRVVKTLIQCSSYIELPPLIPSFLREKPEDFASEDGGVGLHVGGGEVLDGLEAVEDAEELVLDEVDEDEVDGGVVGDCGWVGGDEVGGVEEGLRDGRYVSNVGRLG